MIEQLTDNQQKQLSIYRDKWIEIGLSTNQLDVEAALEAAKGVYTAADLTPPTQYEVLDSPFAAISLMKEKYGVTVTSSDFIFGSHEAPWLSFYNFMEKVVKVDGLDRVNPLIELAIHCGWVLLYDDVIVLTSKPQYIKFDNNNLAHSDNDYAIKYPDGTGVAVWHGQRIPSEWIFNKTSLTPEVFLHWENIEQRRCACEIVGWASVLKQLDAKEIDKDVDPTIGTLLEVTIPDIGTERFLVAIDPNTNKEIGLPVPSEVTTALEANSWTYGIDKFEFKPDFRV